MAVAKLKENQHVQPIISEDFQSILFKVKTLDDLVLHMDRLHPDIVRRAACVGLAQVRIVDAAAVPAADKDGNIIPEVERLATKRARMAALIAHYESGTNEWSRVGEGNGGKSITLEAIARIKDIEYDQAEAEVADFADKHYKGDTKKALAFLREGERVQKMIEAIKAERRPAPKVDADAALDELTSVKPAAEEVAEVAEVE